MSGNKMTDTKVFDDLREVDSGFDSAHLNIDIDSGEFYPEPESEPEPKPQGKDPKKDARKKVDTAEKIVDPGDSGALDLDCGMERDELSELSEGVSDINLIDPLRKGAKNVNIVEKIVDTGDSGALDLDCGLEKDELLDLSEGASDSNLIDWLPGASNQSAPVAQPQPTTKLPLELLYQQDEDGDTQLHIAAAHGYEKPMSILIRLCPKKEILNLRNDYGHTALHLAVMSTNAVITRMLVLAGADVRIRDRRGDNPLHKAIAAGNVKCIQALLMPVVQNLQRKKSPALDQKNYEGQACVHVAASLGHFECIQALLFYGADINLQENLAGSTALHIAARRGDARLIQFLQRCSSCNPRTRDFMGRTPRRYARHNRTITLFEKHEDSDSDTDSEADIDEEFAFAGFMGQQSQTCA